MLEPLSCLILSPCLSSPTTGILSAASLAGGLLSGRCPPPGPAFMMVLLAAGLGGGGGGGALAVGGSEWRATAALVTCSASLLRVGLLLLENGASVGPLPEVCAVLWCVRLCACVRVFVVPFASNHSRRYRGAVGTFFLSLSIRMYMTPLVHPSLFSADEGGAPREPE